MKVTVLLPTVIGTLLSLAVSSYAQKIVINEIHYHPANGAVGVGEDPEDLQFIEVYNAGDASANLTGWAFTAGITHTFAATTLDVGEYLVLAKNATFLQNNVSPPIPGGVQIIQWDFGNLDNNGETLTLQNDLAVTVDTVTYDDVAPWPVDGDGFGPSLELVNAGFDNSFGSVWRASSGTNGTPGASNSVYSENPIVLSEAPARGSIITSLTEVSVTFVEPVQNVVASNLTVNSSLATSVICDVCSSGVGAGPYVFSGFAAPITSPITVALAPGSIQDEDTNPFGGDTWIYAFDPPDIIINELHYNPDGGDDLEEFIELYNAEPGPVDISGWSLTEFSNQGYTFPPSTTLGAGSFVVVARNPAALQTATGFLTTHGWDPDDKLANGGEPVALEDDTGIIVDRVVYSDGSPWPEEPDGDGPSLELLNPSLDNSLPGAWAASIGDHGTPGAENSVSTDVPLVIGETPARGTAVETLSEVTVIFSTLVENVTAGDLLVAGSAATMLDPPTGPADTYTFSGFDTPSVGSIVIVMSAGSIQAAGGGLAFGGDWWMVSHGLNVVINELHYHPVDSNGTAEFVELYNAGSNTADLANWTICDGVDLTFPTGTTLNPGEYLVIAQDPVLLATLTGYGGALAWSDGRLSNGGEGVALCDDVGNELDVVNYDDAAPWPMTPDGTGPSLELINPLMPNEYGAAWAASTGDHGTPGAQNSEYQAVPAPIILDAIHDPPIPAPAQDVLITATVIDDTPNPTVTLYCRQDQDPTIAYSSVVMLDDGFHGDGVANDNIYGAIVAGLANEQRLDFTIRADDGSGVSAAPPGHDTLNAGEYPSQTYLCKFENFVPDPEFPTHHMITTQRTRNLQETIDRTDYDATFIQSDTSGGSEIFYNITERYRGHSTLISTPHGFRLDFSDDHPLQSKMGFEVADLILMAQEIDRQHLGYQFFRETFGGSIPTPVTQFVRFNTNPLAHGGVQNWIYINLERVDDKFLNSQGGGIDPERFPDKCDDTGDPCDNDDDCSGACVDMADGNMYRARHTGDLDYRGEDPDLYRATVQPDGSTDYGYEKETNETEDNWEDLIDLCFAVDAAITSDEDLETAVSALIDEEEWTRWFAVHMLLANGEGGLYRDSGDDYFVYFEPPESPNGGNAKLIPWDLDSVWGGHWYLDNYWEQPTIWRAGCGHPCNPFKDCPSPLANTAGRFVRSNAFAGRFVKTICDLLDNEFTEANVNAMIDALPETVLAQSPYYGTAEARRTQLKNWVAARRTTVTNEIVSQLTLEGVPASPYTSPNPVISLSGDLNQCGTHSVVVNGEAVDYFSVFKNPYPAKPCGFQAGGGDWSEEFILSPGLNEIVVQCLDHNGVEIDRVESSVTYNPAPTSLRLTMPTRMVEDKTLTLKGELLDAGGNIHWRTWNTLGTVSAWRELDQSTVPISITVFETHADGVGGGTPPDDSIRFYNGVGSVSITLDDHESVAGEEIRIFVTVEGFTESKVVSVLANEPATFKELSGTLSGADLTWGPADGVIHLTGDVTVPSGETLTIAPNTLVMVDAGPAENGTRVLLDSSAVDAQGTEANPIFFFPTAGPVAMELPQCAQNNPSSWRGFLFSGSGSSTFSYVFLTGAGNGAIEFHPRPPVFYLAEGGSHSLSMTDCVFADSPGEIVFTKGTGSYTISRCLFSRVGIGGEFVGQNDYELLIEDSWFTRIGRALESCDADGDMLHLDQVTTTPQTIRGCILTDGGDDVIDHSNGAHPIIENCIIYDARDKAISLYYSGDITMTNCLVFDVPGGIRATGRPVFLTNCTLSRNTQIDDRQCNYSDLDKCIFWPISVVTCCNDVNYTLIGNPGHLGCGTCNFSEDPLFVDSTNNDFNLQPGSPAIDVCDQGRIGWLGFHDATTCGTDADCDDGIFCNGAETCDTNGNCQPGDDPCPGRLCRENDDQCVECLNDSDCDDGIFCNGAETCDTNGDCYPGYDPCPGQLCDEDNDTCSNGECDDDGDCDDGLFCNGTETCVGNVCVEGVAPCDDPCEQCDESTDTCDWCIFDLDGDGFIGPGDFSFFAGCYGGNYGCDPPDYRSGVEPCCIANFDESGDSFVGPGDFAGFAGCFGLNCDECATCWGSRSSKGRGAAARTSELVSVKLVAVRAPTPVGVADALPRSGKSFLVGQTFYIELWASNTGSEDGLAAVYVDMEFAPTRLKVLELVPGERLGLFAHGALESEPGLVYSWGGCSSLGEGALGVGSWVRVATLEARALRVGKTLVKTSPSVGGYGIAVLNRLGTLDKSLITFDEITLRMHGRKRVIRRQEGVSMQNQRTKRGWP